MAKLNANIADRYASGCSLNPDVETWRDVRRYNLQMMRKQILYVVLFMALIEALRVGPVRIVNAGKHGYPARPENDFGWWADKIFPNTPEDPSKPSTAMKIMCFLKKLNMILLHISIGISLITYACYVIHTFIYVDSRPYGSKTFPMNTRKNWGVRAFMLFGIAITTSLGHGTFHILAEMDLAHVKALEYAIIVVPVLVTLGIALGSVVQIRMEKRIAHKQALLAARAEECVADEKAALMKV